MVFFKLSLTYVYQGLTSDSPVLCLLQKLSITATGKREKLMRVIKNPVTQCLPLNSCKMGFSFSSEKLVNMRHYVDSVSEDLDLVFVVGAMAHGKVNCDYIEDFIVLLGPSQGFVMPPQESGMCFETNLACAEKFSNLM